jgi:hypothetical protein
MRNPDSRGHFNPSMSTGDHGRNESLEQSSVLHEQYIYNGYYT